jgi:hypothetical protein
MQTQFHVKWINYLDEDRTWREIDPNFVETATGFEMTQAPFEVRVPLSARGAATFVNKNRWDVRKRRLVDEPPLEQTMRALGVADVYGRIERGNLGWGETQYVVYPNAYPEVAADLIYWVHQGRIPRLQKFIRFREALARDTAFRFEIAFAEDVEMVNDGRSVTVRARGATGRRANSLHSFYFWDSQGGWNGQRDIRFDMEPLDAASGRLAGDSQVYTLIKHSETDFSRVAVASTDRRPAGDERVYVLTKHIEADFFRSAVLPAFTDTDFYPDEYNTPGATSVDGVVGYIGPDGTAWSTVRNSPIGTDVSDSGITFRITTRKCASANMGRGITDFDTSSLGAGTQIQSATLYLAQCFGAVPGGDCGTENPAQITVGIVGHTPANPATLVVSDYSNGMTLNGTVEYAPRMVMANAPNAYTSFPLNVSGLNAINPTGNTNFMLRSQFDLDNNDPGCVNRELQIYASEWGGTNLDPKLSVNHVNACNPPLDLSVDNRKASGLAMGSVSNERVENGELKGDFQIENFLRVWLGITTYGSPIFTAVQKKQCQALYRVLKKSLESPESAVGAGSEWSHVDRSVGALL